MRREDFVVDDIPANYRVYDVDFSPSGELLAVVGHRSDESAPVFAKLRESMFQLPDAWFWIYNVTKEIFCANSVRWVGDEHILVTTGLPKYRGEVNSWIHDKSGAPRVSFHAGEGHSEVLANDDWIVFTYSDEGIFGYDKVSKNGISFFDRDGSYKFGYREKFSDGRIDISDVYCASWVSGNQLVFFPYTGFPLVRIDLDAGSEEVCSTPEAVAGSHAISTLGDRVFFHSPYPGVGSAEPGDFLSWEIGSDEVYVEGHHENVPLPRGLPGGRFLAVNPNGYTILSFD